MRKLLLGLMLLAPIEAASAASVQVEANTVLRLPVKGESLSLEHVRVAEGGALLIPSRVKVLHIDALDLQKNARLGVFPGEQPLRIEVARGHLADGSVIAAQGASGSFHRPASAGRTLTLRLQDVQVENLLVDVRGGVGAPSGPAHFHHLPPDGRAIGRDPAQAFADAFDVGRGEERARALAHQHGFFAESVDVGSQVIHGTAMPIG